MPSPTNWSLHQLFAKPQNPHETLQNHPYNYQHGYCSHHPPTPSHLSQPCPLVHKTPPFHLLIYQPVDNGQILPPKLHPNNNTDLITLSLNLSTPTTFLINQLATKQPKLFSTLQPPLQRNLKPFPIILTPCPLHLTSCKQEISTQRLFKVSNIHPTFPTQIPHSMLKTRFQIVHQEIFPSFKHECIQFFLWSSVLSF